MKRNVTGALLLVGGLFGFLLLAMPKGIVELCTSEAIARWTGACLVVGCLVTAFGRGPSRAEAATAASPTSTTWRRAPWIALAIAGCALLVFLALHQLTYDWPGARRDKFLTSPVLVFAVGWAAASGAALLCILAGLLRKARGQETAALTSPLLAALVCGLTTPIWLFAMMMAIQLGAPP